MKAEKKQEKQGLQEKQEKQELDYMNEDNYFEKLRLESLINRSKAIEPITSNWKPEVSVNNEELSEQDILNILSKERLSNKDIINNLDRISLNAKYKGIALDRKKVALDRKIYKESFKTEKKLLALQNSVLNMIGSRISFEIATEDEINSRLKLVHKDWESGSSWNIALTVITFVLAMLDVALMYWSKSCILKLILNTDLTSFEFITNIVVPILCIVGLIASNVVITNKIRRYIESLKFFKLTYVNNYNRKYIWKK